MTISTKQKKRFGIAQIEGYLWLLPFMIFYGIFTLWMLLQTGVLSFQEYNLMRGGVFNGLANYKFLFTDPAFWSTLKNTSLFVLVSTPIFLLIPLAFAVLIEHKVLTGKDFFRTTLFAPYILPVSIVAYTFVYILTPYTGLLNNLLRLLGILGVDEEIYWLASVPEGWISIIIETRWWTSGFNLILYIAGIKEIPPQYYESAEIDGAGFFKQVAHITMPLLGRVHYSLLFMQLVSSFKIFSQAYLLTGGAPGGGTRTYIHYFYDIGFRSSKFGRAAACAMVLFFIVLLVSVLQTRLSNRFIQE